jgi:lipopolysaccharide export system protein LptA
MASVKTYSGNLIIQTPFKNSVPSNITLDTDHLFVTGNLTIRGNTTIIKSNTQVITDNTITLNAGETGNGVSTLGTFSGIEIDRGTAPGGNVYLAWNEEIYAWQITGVGNGDGAVAVNIATTTGGVAISSVFDDNAPVLGGNLNVNGKTIYANVAAGTYVTLQGALELKSANVTPSAATGSTIFYASDTGAGQAGVFVVNPASANEELVTKRRAFGFSLLL